MIDATLTSRFRTDFAALATPPSPAAPLGIAVSGGADSVALLLLAHAAWPGAVSAATVDHGMRAEATDEARQVAGLCATLSVPHATLTADAAGATGNRQHWARATRYRLLADWAARGRIAAVAVAHHADDVAETFLMRAARGAGVRGLAAMPAVRVLDRSAVLLVRPLLGWRRAELAAVVANAGIAAILDPSNGDPRFNRARVRRLLGASADLPTDRLAATAANLRDAEEAIEWAVQQALAGRFAEDDAGVRLDVDGLPFEVRRRLVLRAVETVRQQRGVFGAWRETAVPDLVRALAAGGGGTGADVIGTACGDRWQFRAAPPRRSDETGPARDK